MKKAPWKVYIIFALYCNWCYLILQFEVETSAKLPENNPKFWKKQYLLQLFCFFPFFNFWRSWLKTDPKVCDTIMCLNRNLKTKIFYVYISKDGLILMLIWDINVLAYEIITVDKLLQNYRLQITLPLLQLQKWACNLKFVLTVSTINN